MSSSLAPISLVHHLRNPPQGDLHSRPRQHSCRQPISPSCPLSRIHHIPSGSTGVVSPSVSGRRTVVFGPISMATPFLPLSFSPELLPRSGGEEATLLLLVHLARQALVLELLTMLVHPPIFLPLGQDLLSQSGQLHPNSEFLTLTAWKICGVDSISRELWEEALPVIIGAWTPGTCSSYRAQWNIFCG